MNNSTSVLTKAFSSYVAEMVRRIAAREGIDLNSIKSQGAKFTIGEPKTGLYLTVKPTTKPVKSAIKPNMTFLTILVSSPNGTYSELITAPNIGTTVYKGELLKAMHFNFVNQCGHTQTGCGLWSEHHGGFISFNNNLNPYDPVGGLAGCKGIEKTGLVFNADIFICIPKSL
jgi:hypothetical protein